MNEPSGAPTQTAIWSAYNGLYQTVRAVDPDHMCMMEGTWTGTGTNGESLNWQWDVLPPPTPYNWSNVVYEMHAYAGHHSLDGVKTEANKQVNDFKSHQVAARIGMSLPHRRVQLLWHRGFVAVRDSAVQYQRHELVHVVL